MKIPAKVKIGGHELDIIITNDGDVLESNCIGKTYLAKNVIYLNANYPRSRQEEALLHEMIHNCLFDLKEEQDEQMVERLGGYFYMVLKDNKFNFGDSGGF